MDFEKIVRRLHDNDPMILRLNISRNNIGDCGASEIADALKVNNTLLELSIFGNNIKESGASKIADALKINSTLLKLYIGYIYIGDDKFGESNMKIIRNKLMFNMAFIKNNILNSFKIISKKLPNEIVLKILANLLQEVDNAEELIYETLNARLIKILH